MIRRLRSPSPALIVAIFALVAAVSGVAVAGVAVIPSAKTPSTVHACVKSKSGKLRVASKCRRGERGIDLQSGAAKPLAGPQGPGGSQGPNGQNGDRGPSFGDGKQVPNVSNIPCGSDVVVGSQTLTVPEPSRIWIHGQGTLGRGGSTADDYGLWLQLRNAGDTATLAVSTREWGKITDTAPAELLPLSSGGLMLSGEDPDASDPSAPAFVAPAGSYTLQLAVTAGPLACAGSLPDFGFNQGNSMGYMLLGTG